jgi:hypothetical protein
LSLLSGEHPGELAGENPGELSVLEMSNNEGLIAEKPEGKSQSPKAKTEKTRSRSF